jgi:eukaryotic-like serine/threonine-protein kinase
MPASTKLKGRYELKEVLAKGGMGVVYRAVDGVMRRQVAIKTLLDMTDAFGLQLFQKECEVLASMTHPNIIEIYDVGEFEEEGVSRPYLVMPLLPGVTLDKLIRASSQRLTVDRSIDIACQACRGLQAAHEKGLVHRDVKPSNIFVLEDDSIKIIDFGVAHRIEASRTAGRKGTLLYMAPEQIEMKPVSAVSDIFSLGVVCYEMLTRRRPFERATENSVADAILHFIPVPASELNPAVSQAVSQAIHKAMAKQPWHRYATAKEFAETLQKALRNEPIELFNVARMRPRLQRALETLERGDCQYASEIVSELEGEGHLDPAISELRRKVDEAIRRKTVGQLLDTAHSRIETEEYPLALQRIYEVLQLDPANAEALSLKSTVENKRTERDMEEWFRLAAQHFERFDFSHAREALQHVLQLRPKEGRARQMLSEVDRLEREHARARLEKEQLYQAAVAADQRGDISSALSKLERVLDLDRRVPDAAAPERATNYQNLYNKVRSEHESTQRAYAEAKHQLETAEFQAALSICADQLAKYPENALFQALKIDIEEQHRQALSARIAEIDRKVDAEPDLDRRITIVEDAVRANPGERHFQQLLQRTREKQNLIESIVVRARKHEQQSQFSEALSQWEIVKTIYDQYPGLSMEVDRVVRRRDQHLRLDARNRWVEQIDRMLESREYDRALELLAEAQAEHSGDTELAQLEKMVRQGLEKTAEARNLIAQGQAECSAGRYQEGLEILTRAYELDDRNPAAATALRDALVEQARGVLDSDPAAAGQLLHRALKIEPEDGEAKSLLSLLDDHRRKAAVDRCVSEIRRLQSQEELRAASLLVEQGLQTFPSEARLVQLQTSLKKNLDDARRRDLEEVKKLRQDTGTALDEPALRSHCDRLEEITQAYGDDPEFRAAAESVRRSLERSPVPVEEPASKPSQEESRTEPEAEVKKTAPVVRTVSVWQQALAVVKARPRLWGAGAVAGLAVLLVIGVVNLTSKGKPVNPLIPQSGTLALTTTPPGAAVYVNGKPSGIAVPGLMSVPPGSVTIEARMPGYQTAKATADVAAGARVPVSLTLTPVVMLKLQFPSEVRIAINNEEPVTVQDGPFLRELPAGAYAVKLSTGRSGTIAFAFEVRPEGAAAITEPPRTQEVSALLISNFGDQTRIYSGASSVEVKLDGQALGQLDKKGLDLPKLTSANHELELGTDKDLRKHPIEIGPERTLTVILESDPNTGTLVVQTNEDDVAITVLVNGKEVKHGTARNKTFHVANLKAGKYSVRAAKEGYDADPTEQQAEFQKGETKTVAFQFRRQAAAATAKVRLTLTPGSELFVDGNPVGIAQSDTRVLDLKPMAHTFRAERGKQFQPVQKTLELTVSQTADLDLRLTALPVPVEIKKTPPDSTVTYTRAGDKTVHSFVGTRQELPEGDYTFTARAKDYLERNAIEHISWDSVHPIDLKQDPAPPSFGMADWDKGVWTPEGRIFKRTAAGFVIFKKPLSFVQFMVHAQGGKYRAHWLLHYVNEKNYIQCLINDEGIFQALRISETKAPEILAGKNGVPKSDWYTIRISARSDGATISLETDGRSEQLADVKETGFAQTRFGFNVPGGQQLFLASFDGRGF